MPRKYLIVLFFVAFVGARHAVPLQGLVFAQVPETECPPECVTDSLEIITYYPSPYGYYEELRGDKIIVGDTDNSRIDETHLPPSGTITFEPMLDDPDASDGNLYEGSLYYQEAIGGTKGKFRFYDGTDWQDLGGSGGGYWKPSDIDSNNIYYDTGNVGIGVGANEAIGARLQIDVGEFGKKGLILKSVINRKGSVYNYSGGVQYYRVPSGVNRVIITAYGSQGGSSKRGVGGGKGGKVKATINVDPGETLYVYVGGRNGYNGGGGAGGGGAGGDSNGGQGGGASDIRQGRNDIANRIIVAGGGGGGGGDSGGGAQYGIGGNGGVGGGNNGGVGQDGYCNGDGQGRGGSGGAQALGGAGGNGGSGSNGIAGLLAQGGAGGAGGPQGGGAGGGGYYGGGGGGAGYGGGGGGGGSNYATGSDVSMDSGVRVGDGMVIIEEFWESSSYLTEWQDKDSVAMSVVDTEGKFGIGTAIPSAALDIAAGKTTIADAWSTRSSLRFKENFYPIDNALNKLSSLRGVYFDYKDSHKHSLGLVAEDVGKVFPELVTYETNGQDAVSLDYDKLGAVTIEAIKEQQKEIETQREEITQLRNLLKETSRSQQKEIELLKAEKKAAS